MTPETTWFVVGLVVLGGYLGWCALYPYRTCGWCKGRTRVGDGRGNFRPRRPCAWCGGTAIRRRLGARMIGRGK